MADKVNILIISFGGIGCMTAYNLEASGLATVIEVLCSSFQVINEKGIEDLFWREN